MHGANLSVSAVKRQSGRHRAVTPQSARRRLGGSHRPNGEEASIFQGAKCSRNVESTRGVRIARADFPRREPPRRRRSYFIVTAMSLFEEADCGVRLAPVVIKSGRGRPGTYRRLPSLLCRRASSLRTVGKASGLGTFHAPPIWKSATRQTGKSAVRFTRFKSHRCRKPACAWDRGYLIVGMARLRSISWSGPSGFFFCSWRSMLGWADHSL